jgi:hypothetical protein
VITASSRFRRNRGWKPFHSVAMVISGPRIAVDQADPTLFP